MPEEAVFTSCCRHHATPRRAARLQVTSSCACTARQATGKINLKHPGIHRGSGAKEEHCKTLSKTMAATGVVGEHKHFLCSPMSAGSWARHPPSHLVNTESSGPLELAHSNLRSQKMPFMHMLSHLPLPGHGRGVYPSPRPWASGAGPLATSAPSCCPLPLHLRLLRLAAIGRAAHDSNADQVIAA